MKRFLIFLLIAIASNAMLASSSSSSSSSSNSKQTYFGKTAAELRNQLIYVLHPVMHRAAEQKDDILSALKEAGGSAFAGDPQKSLSTLWSNPSVRNNLINNVVWGAKLGARGLVKNGIKKVFGKDGLKVVDRSGIFDYADYVSEDTRPKGSNSMACLDFTADEGRLAFKEWHSNPSCTKGVHECPLLGHNSRGIIKKMNAFFDHISSYEKKVGEKYFPDKEVDEVANFFKEVNYRLFDENILHAIAGPDEQSTIANDRDIKPLIKILDYLLALPTKMHNPKAHVEKNKAKIEKLISILPTAQQKDIWSIIDKIIFRAENPSFGQSAADAAIYLVLKGKTATGKTHTGTHLLQHLGYSLIQLTFDEAREGQEKAASGLKQLSYDDKVELSGLGKKLLKLNKSGKPSVTLNQICFVDETDEDNQGYNESDIKRQFDNFKRIYFPALGLSAPGRLGFFFTTNNKELFTKPTLLTRFTQLLFPPMKQEIKEEILYDNIIKTLERYPQLSSKYDFKKIINILVLLAPKINVKILLKNADDVIVYFKAQHEGRSRFNETFAELVLRKFKLRAVPQKAKVKVICHEIDLKLSGYPLLSSKYDFEKIVKILVGLTPKINDNILLQNIDGVIDYFKVQHEGAQNSEESFAEYISRIFKLDKQDELDAKESAQHVAYMKMIEKENLNFYLKKVSSNASSSSSKQVDNNNDKMTYCSDDDHADEINSNPNSPHASGDDNDDAVALDTDSESDSYDSDDDKWQGANKGKTSSSSSSSSTDFVPKVTNDLNAASPYAAKDDDQQEGLGSLLVKYAVVSAANAMCTVS